MLDRVAVKTGLPTRAGPAVGLRSWKRNVVASTEHVIYGGVLPEEDRRAIAELVAKRLEQLGWRREKSNGDGDIVLLFDSASARGSDEHYITEHGRKADAQERATE